MKSLQNHREIIPKLSRIHFETNVKLPRTYCTSDLNVIPFRYAFKQVRVLHQRYLFVVSHHCITLLCHFFVSFHCINFFVSPTENRIQTIATGKNACWRNSVLPFPLRQPFYSACRPANIPSHCSRRNLPFALCLHKLPYPPNQQKRTSPRPISIGQLNALPRLHLRPINLVVYKGPYWLKAMGNLVLRAASRLDAFSVYPFQIWLRCHGVGRQQLHQ